MGQGVSLSHAISINGPETVGNDEAAQKGAVMPRTKLTDRQWRLIEPLLPGKAADPGRTGMNNRMTLEGIIWVMRTGAPWRDLNPKFGKWNTIHKRFRRWTMAGVFDRIFKATHGNLDLRTVMVDGSFAKVHQHGTGAPKADAHPMNRPNVRLLAVVAVG